MQIEAAQNEQRKIQEEEYRIEQKTIAEDKIQISELGKIFTERLNQEKELLITKIQIYNKKFHEISIIHTDEIKNFIKELEEQENDCEKTLKKINKTCDDYIKQCKNTLSNKALIETSIKNIEQIRNVLLNLVNVFVSGIKNTENKILRASLEISEGSSLICNNDVIEVDISSIDNSILLIESKEDKTGEGKKVEKKEVSMTEEEIKRSCMRDYIKSQLQRTDIEEIKKMEDMYFNTTSLSYFKDTIPYLYDFNSIEDYKIKLNDILSTL